LLKQLANIILLKQLGTDFTIPLDKSRILPKSPS
jgi:hypothetical protein